MEPEQEKRLVRGAAQGDGGCFEQLITDCAGQTYALALRMNMPAFMLKAVSSVIVVLAISGPYLRQQAPLLIRRWKASREGGRS